MLSKTATIIVRLATIGILVAMVLSWLPNIAIQIPVLGWLVTPIAKIMNIALFWLPGVSIIVTVVLLKLTMAAALKGSTIAFRVISWIFTVTD